VSAPREATSRLSERIDSGDLSVLPWQTMEPHVLSGLMTLWLRTMPHPIIPYDVQTSLLSVWKVIRHGTERKMIAHHCLDRCTRKRSLERL
jgi:hypothetical protein